MIQIQSEGERGSLSREQRRSKRKRVIRARTISIKRMSRPPSARDDGRKELGVRRPATRADCVDGPRPCPHVWCKYHLYLDVSPRTGAIKLNFPDLEVWELGASCVLDVADSGGSTLEDIGELMNLTRERIRQLELQAVSRLASVRDMHALREYGPEQAERLV